MHSLNTTWKGSNKIGDMKAVCGTIILVIGIVALFFILRWILIKHYEKSTAAYQNKLLKNQIDEVHNVYMTMRGWRHDYHNHMQSLKAYLAMDNTEAAWNYLDKLETDLDNINLLFDTGNIGVDAILNSKISLAINNGISVDYKATVPEHTAVTDIDLCKGYTAV